MTFPYRRSEVSGQVGDWLTPSWYDGEIQPAWNRPLEWPELPSVTTSDNKWVGLLALFPNALNTVGLHVTTSSGTYNVDWGDGTMSTGVSSGTLSEKLYDYSSIGTSPLSYGYKTVTVIVTANTGNIATIENRRPTTHFPGSNMMDTAWLDVACASPSLTGMLLNNVAANIVAHFCQRVSVVRSNITNVSNVFNGMYGLREAYFRSDSVANFSSAFSGCYSLIKADVVTTSNTNFSSMFGNCTSLRAAPILDLSSATSTASMFTGCSRLTTIGALNMPNNTNASSMFNNCSALTSVGTITVSSSGTNCTSMFSGCRSLKNGPTIIGLPNNTNSMFLNCESLEVFPNMSWSATTSTANMFNTCRSLPNVPALTLPVATAINNMFSNCDSLREFGGITAPSATLANTLLSAARPLVKVGPITLLKATSVDYLLEQTAAVDCGTIAVPLITSSSLMLNNPVSYVLLPGLRCNLDVSNKPMTASTLNAIYTGLAGLGTKTISTCSGDGTKHTYTTTTDHTFVVGQAVTVTGVTPSGYNVTNAIITDVTSNTFKALGTTTATYTSGGSANGGSAATMTVTGCPGASNDDPTIATNKGWTVTG